MKTCGQPLGWILVGAIRGYQLLVSPALPRRCKYYPSCSQYAIDAIRTYGVLRGLILACWRLLRCNPMSYGGYDPVERQRVFKRMPRGLAGTALTALQVAGAGATPGTLILAQPPASANSRDFRECSALVGSDRRKEPHKAKAAGDCAIHDQRQRQEAADERCALEVTGGGSTVEARTELGAAAGPGWRPHCGSHACQWADRSSVAAAG